MKKLLLILSLLPCIALSQVTDADGNTYKTKKIGTQTWMAENLNVDHFRNGDPIKEVTTIKEWVKTEKKGKPACCYYDNAPANGKKYGKLYNWFAVNDSRGLAPAGWHIPTDEEWKTLADFLGGGAVAGTKMKSTSNWITEGNGTNEGGFTGLSGGARQQDGSFKAHKTGYYGYWWSSTEYNSSLAWYRFLSYNYGVLSWDFGEKKSGFSVRCIKD